MDVYDAYKGVHHRFTTNYESLSALANDIHSALGLEPSRQLLLVDPSGNRLKLEAAVEGQRVYVYDKSIISQQLKPLAAPKFGQIEGAASEVMARGKWAQKCMESIADPLKYIKDTKTSIQVVLSASNLAEAHMNVHLKALRRSRDKKQLAFNRVSEDLDVCAPWQDNWKSLEKVSGVGAKLKILDKARTLEAWEAATKASDEIRQLFNLLDIDSEPVLPEPPSHIDGDEDLLQVDMKALCSKLIEDASALERAPHDEQSALESNLNKVHSDIVDEISNIYDECVQLAESVHSEFLETQGFLVKVVREISAVQTNTAKGKKIINEIAERIHLIDQNKTYAAKVIDFPFIYGVGLIEISRRRSWSAVVKHLTNSALSHFEQLRKTEYERIDRWTSRYSSLNMIDKIVSVDVKLPLVTMDFEEPQFDEPTDIHDYFHSLEAAGFHEVAGELRSELDAMSHQLEKSFRGTSKARSIFPDMDASQVIREEHQPLLTKPSPPSQEAELRARSELESKLKAEIENELHEKIEKELHAKVETELREKLEREVRAQVESELSSEIESRVSSKLNAQIRNSVELEKNQELHDLRLANEELHSRIAKMEDMHSSEITELQEQINAFQNGDPESIDTGEDMGRWVENLKDKTHDLSQRLYANSHNLEIVLEKMGLQTKRKIEDGMVSYSINRVRGLSRRTSRSKENVSGSSTLLTSSEVVPPAPKIPDPSLLHWVSSPQNDDEYRLFIQEVYIDYDIFRQVVGDRFADVEKIARKYHAEVKSNREKIRQLEQTVRYRLALSQFKVGDLILFLPTRDVARSPNPWAAFNINCPHYFLDPKNAADLGTREFLIGRATAIVQHKVLPGDTGDKNPFDLPEGLRWNMITAQWK